uniref:Uncharacterized protein n=1 Tax=Ciona intestinalis TaxID=7719 RepID=H2XW84_CIOIN
MKACLLINIQHTQEAHSTVQQSMNHILTHKVTYMVTRKLA